MNTQSYVYFLYFSSERAYKIGKANCITNRQKTLVNVWGEWDRAKSFALSVKSCEVFDIESFLHDYLNKYKHTPITANDGYTEFFCINQKQIEKAVGMVNKLFAGSRRIKTLDIDPQPKAKPICSKQKEKALIDLETSLHGERVLNLCIQSLSNECPYVEDFDGVEVTIKHSDFLDRFGGKVNDIILGAKYIKQITYIEDAGDDSVTIRGCALGIKHSPDKGETSIYFSSKFAKTISKTSPILPC